MQYLVGFYREQKKIKSLYSDSPFIQDKVLNVTYESQIIPLEILDDNIEWKLSSDADYLDSFLKQFFKKGQRFKTTTISCTDWYCFMLTEVGFPSMARTGVLLKKEEDGFKPVIVTCQDEDYLIEIKGVGSPVGGFPSFHLRRQAGSNAKAHLRLTGGISWTGALREFTYLEKNRVSYKDHDQPYHIRSLAYGKFEFENDEIKECFGQVLRLTPSTVRASFVQPGLNHVIDKKNVLISMGIAAGLMTQLNPPILHGNFNFNNMVFVTPDDFLLTDWEEGFDLVSGHVALETPIHCCPIGLNPEHFEDDLVLFQEGMKSIQGECGRCVEDYNFNNSISFNREILQRCYGLQTWKKRLESHYTDTGLEENISVLKWVMPNIYFAKSIHEWLEQDALNLFQLKLNVLLGYAQCIERFGCDDLNQFIQNPNSNNHCYNHLIEIAEQLPQWLENRSINRYSWENLGAFVSIETFESLHLNEVSSLDEVKKRITSYQKVVEDVQLLLRGELQLKVFREDLYATKLTSDSIQTISLICPYVFFIYFYLEHEIQLLLGVLDGKETIPTTWQEKLQKQIVHCHLLQENLLKDPLSFHSYFQRDDIIEYIMDL